MLRALLTSLFLIICTISVFTFSCNQFAWVPLSAFSISYSPLSNSLLLFYFPFPCTFSVAIVNHQSIPFLFPLFLLSYPLRVPVSNNLFLIIFVSFPVPVSRITFRFLNEIFDKLTARLKQINYLLTAAWTIEFYILQTASAFACRQLQGETWQDVSPSYQQHAINLAKTARQRPFICQNLPYTTAETSMEWKHHSCSNAKGLPTASPSSVLPWVTACTEHNCHCQCTTDACGLLAESYLRPIEAHAEFPLMHNISSNMQQWEGAVGNVCFRPPQNKESLNAL